MPNKKGSSVTQYLTGPFLKVLGTNGEWCWRWSKHGGVGSGSCYGDGDDDDGLDTRNFVEGSRFCGIKFELADLAAIQVKGNKTRL